MGRSEIYCGLMLSITLELWMQKLLEADENKKIHRPRLTGINDRCMQLDPGLRPRPLVVSATTQYERQDSASAL